MVLKATFNLSGRSCQVVLDDSGLSWEPEGIPHASCRVPAAEILSCWPCPRGSVKCFSSSTSSCSTHPDRTPNSSTKLSDTSHPTYTSVNTSTTSPTDTYSVVDEVKSLIVDASMVTVSLQEPQESNLRASSTASLLSEEAPTSSEVFPSSLNTISPGNFTCQPTFNPGHVHLSPASYQVHPTSAPQSNGCAYQEGAAGGGPQSSHMKEESVGGRMPPPTTSKLRPSCRHTAKDNHFPGLSVEVCQRVRPSRWFGCLSGDDEDDVVLTEWNTHVFVFHHVSIDIVCAWNDAIWDALRRVQERPRHLVVIINPFGGRQMATTVYGKTVAPLLQRAAVNATVHSTTHSGHAQELAQEAASTTGVDGVVAVGGDGIVTEVVNGLMRAAVKLANVDANDANLPLPESSIRLGVIPAGSTDAYINSLHGTRCTLTATLHIIMGSRRRVDVAAIYTQSRLDRFVSSAIHLGFLGGLQETGSKLRHMGPFRDVLGFLKEAALNRSYTVSMRVLTPDRPSASPFDHTGCSAACIVCDRAGKKKDDSVDQRCTWVDVKGEYTSLTSLLVCLQCVYLPNGLSPSAHVGDGTTDLVLLPKSSRFRLLTNQVRPLLSKNFLSSPHVHVLRAQQVQFSNIGEKTPWSYDGELNYSTGLLFKVHCQRLHVFCRGPERPFATNAPCKRRAL